MSVRSKRRAACRDYVDGSWLGISFCRLFWPFTHYKVHNSMSVYRQPDYSVLVRCPKSGSNLLLTLNVPHIRLDDKGQMDHLLNCLMPLQTLVTDFLQWNRKCEELGLGDKTITICIAIDTWSISIKNVFDKTFDVLYSSSEENRGCEASLVALTKALALW